MKASRQQRALIVEHAHLLSARGWVANHDGNITLKIAPDRYLATPTATAKARVDEQNLIEIDSEGKRVAGTARPFSESKLHFAVYRQRDDIRAVVHAHPPHATALACSGNNLIEKPFLPEAVVSLGETIPLVPFAPPGSAASAQLQSVVEEVDALLLANHGVLAWGADLEQAFLRLELVEHLARIATLAQASGGVRPLPDEVVPALLAARGRAGLGRAADRAAKQNPVVACAPAPHSERPTLPAGGESPAPDGELARIIREELLKVLDR